MEEQLELDWTTAISPSVDPPTKPDRIQTTDQVSAPPLNSPLPSAEQAERLVQAAIIPGCAAIAAGLDPNSDPQARICYLEQALDQCLIYIHELKGQLADQAFLETQLAATEDVSNIQQQAIITLKAQLVDQQVLATQLAQTHEQKQALERELSQTEALVLQQQLELEQLQQQCSQSQTRLSDLEQELTDRQLLIQHLSTRLDNAQQAIATHQEVIAALQQAQGSDSSKNKAIQALSKTLLQAQNKIEALETEFSNQLILQAQLQHSGQELEAQRLQYQQRMAQLEQQVAEMQEQILHQAQQASEYETAVQHWKDRCLTAEQSVHQLKAVLEQLLVDRQGIELPSIPGAELQEDQAMKGHTAEVSSTIKGLKLDLPGFLRRYPFT